MGQTGAPMCALGAALENTPCAVCGLVCACLGCLVLIISLPACAPRRRMRRSYVALVTTRQLVTTEEFGVDLCGEGGELRTESQSLANIAAVEAQSECCCGSMLSIFLNTASGERRTQKDCCGNVENAPADSSISCLVDAFALAAAIQHAKLTNSQAGRGPRASHQGAGLRAATDTISAEFRRGQAAISGSAKEMYSC